MASRTRPRQSSVTVEVTACAVPIGARRGAWCQRMGGHTPGGGDARAGRAGTARRATGALDWVRGRVDCADALASTVHARAARSQRLLYTHPTRSLPAAPVVASPRVHSTTFYIYYSLYNLDWHQENKGGAGDDADGKNEKSRNSTENRNESSTPARRPLPTPLTPPHLPDTVRHGTEVEVRAQRGPFDRCRIADVRHCRESPEIQNRIMG